MWELGVGVGCGRGLSPTQTDKLSTVGVKLTGWDFGILMTPVKSKTETTNKLSQTANKMS